VRLPGRHDQPLEPLEMNEQDVRNFQLAIASGYGGQADWQLFCSCGHPEADHLESREKPHGGRCPRCSCWLFKPGKSEFLDLWLHPDAVNFLPEGTVVQAHGRRYNHEGLLQFRLMRDVDSGLVHVMRSGAKTETIIYTSPPEGAES